MGTYRSGGFSVTRALRLVAVEVVIWLFRAIDHRPRLERVVFALLRLRSVWRIGHTVLITGDRQVHEVLVRDDDFPLPEERNAKFLTGAFVLGMTRTPQFERERRELEAVVARTDLAWIRELAAAASARAMAAATQHGSFDVVSGLSTPVGTELIQEYFGIKDATVEFAHQLRKLGAMVASPCSQRERFRQEAAEAAQAVYDRIELSIAEAETMADALIRQRAPLPQRATILQRLVYRERSGMSGLDRDGVRRNVTGVLLPGSALVTRAFATSLVQLLRKKRLRDAAVRASETQDLGTLEDVLLEAMRFHPVFPVLPRFAPHDTVIHDFRREIRIRAGRDVYVAVASAMFDSQALLFKGRSDGPSHACLRGPERRHYRHFGGGMHECLGQHLALPQMAAMLAALPRLDSLTCGAIKYNKDDGISPDRLLVRVRAAHRTVVPVPMSTPQANSDDLQRVRAGSR